MAKLISAKRAPSSAEPGTVFFNTVTQETFLALADGRFFNLAGLLSLQPVAVVGPRGEQGPRGTEGPQGAAGINGKPGANSTTVGPQGPIGPRGIAGVHGVNGKDGVNGADSFVPGPKGEKGDTGPAGPKGERGDITVVGDAELHAVVLKYKQAHTRIQAVLLAEISKSESLHPSTKLHIQRVLKTIQKELQ